MKAVLFCYSLDKLSNAKKVELVRNLTGYMEYSNNSKYRYKKEGILESIPSYRPIRGVIVVESKNKNKVTKLLKNFNVVYQTFNTTVPGKILQ